MERITFRPSPEDDEIIRRILMANPALRGNTSGAIRVALVAWETLNQEHVAEVAKKTGGDGPQ